MSEIPVERPAPPAWADYLRPERGYRDAEDPVAVACRLLMSVSGVHTWSPVREDQVKILRAARSASHPDRLAGDRALWDQVQEAASLLGLVRR